MLKHRSVVRPTMNLASMDVKKAFVEVRSGNVAQIMEGHKTHRWIIAAFPVRWLDKKGRPCSNVWRESSLSHDAFAKVVSKLPDYGRKWPSNSWQV